MEARHRKRGAHWLKSRLISNIRSHTLANCYMSWQPPRHRPVSSAGPVRAKSACAQRRGAWPQGPHADPQRWHQSKKGGGVHGGAQADTRFHGLRHSAVVSTRCWGAAVHGTQQPQGALCNQQTRGAPAVPIRSGSGRSRGAARRLLGGGSRLRAAAAARVRCCCACFQGLGGRTQCARHLRGRRRSTDPPLCAPNPQHAAWQRWRRRASGAATRGS